jgi:hypothetical protein
MSTQRLVELWGEGGNSFEVDPNAVLSFAAPHDRPLEGVVVTIRNPNLDGKVLSYQVDFLDGDLPQATGACALIIDPFGRPLSPVSVGVRGAGSRVACAISD